LNRIFATKYIEESLDKKYTGLDRQLRVRKIVKWTYDGIYYSSVTIFGFVVFRNEKWFPTEFGG
jgi:ceramide synthetase